MSGIFNRISLMISRYLSNRLFMKGQGILLGIMTCMLAAGSFSTVFINTFIYRFASEGSILLVIRYNVLMAAFMVLFCCLAGIFAKKMTYEVSMCFGSVVYVAAYVCLIWFYKEPGKYLALISMLSGLGTAFFYISYNSLVNVMVGSFLRKQYVLFQSIISVILGILLPVISGAVILLSGGRAGYVIVFSLCVVMCSVATFLCFMLPKVRGQSRKTYFANVLLKSVTSKKYFLVSACDLIRGLKEGVLAFLMPVIILKIAGNELSVGLYVAVCAIAGILGNFLMNKTNITEKLYRPMLVSAIVQSAVALLLVLWLNLFSVFIFGIVTSLFLPQFQTSLNVEYYSVLDEVDNKLSRKTLETSCVKEIYFNFGRILSVLMLSLVVQNTFAITVLLFAFFMMQLVSWMIAASFLKTRKCSE